MTEKFPVESIPDKDKVFRAILPHWIENGELTSAAYSDVIDEPSVNWEKYSSSIESCQIKIRNQPDPIGIAILIAEIPRSNNMPVEHRPNKNRAHSVIVLGKKDNRSLRRFLARNSLFFSKENLPNSDLSWKEMFQIKTGDSL
jgi:hypothetical protein